jgi:hypothetical protein
VKEINHPGECNSLRGVNTDFQVFIAAINELTRETERMTHYMDHLRWAFQQVTAREARERWRATRHLNFLSYGSE